MTIISLAQIGQCNGCGSVMNDVIFNSHLGSGAGQERQLCKGKGSYEVLLALSIFFFELLKDF